MSASNTFEELLVKLVDAIIDEQDLFPNSQNNPPAKSNGEEK